MQQVKDGYYEMNGGYKTLTPLPVRVWTLHERQMVFGNDVCWPLDHLLDDGYTFTPLVAMPSDIWQTLRDAVLQRKLDLWALAGASTEEIHKTEKLVERYDRAFEWLDGQEVSDGN